MDGQVGMVTMGEKALRKEDDSFMNRVGDRWLHVKIARKSASV